MHLSQREQEKLLIYLAAQLARARQARGLMLNYPEAMAILSAEIMEGAREGRSVVELMAAGKQILSEADVLPGVAELIDEVQVEATFPDGTKLVTVHQPIPSAGLDPPGEVIVAAEPAEIVANAGRPTATLTVRHTGDRPIQIGSHFHFFEVNVALDFDRRAAFGMRLNVPAGTAVRFEPGEEKDVTLVALGGSREVYGLNGLTQGALGAQGAQGAQNESSIPAPPAPPPPLRPLTLGRRQYADLYGPTVGDRVRLADSALVLEVERDFTVYGDEIAFGGGKVIRDGMGQSARAVEALDLVVTNALIVDHWGIVKADIGVKDGRIAGVGKAGNPDILDGVDPHLIVGAGTEALAGERLIVTPGGIDSHVHFICPQQVEEAIASGITTMLGGGTGPATGTNATTCTPGPWNIARMLQAADALPVNLGLLGKGNSSSLDGLRRQVEAGACGLKLHEDWGTTPAAIDASLRVADEYDVQVALHTDTINEAGFFERTIEAIGGRTIHAYHAEGAGGGHAPDIIRIAGEAYVLPSSTNPTRPYTVNTVEEHLDMLMVCHHLNPRVPEDVAFADSRIRAQTMMAEDILHDLGAISMMASDSQAMGRVGEVILRTWQTADKMKRQRGPLPADSERNDNARIKRYLAKYTINPAIAHGIAHEVGSIEPGKLADFVVWEPKFFGVRPKLVVKGGLIAWAAMGDANASIPTPQPVTMRPMFAAHTPQSTSVTFLSAAALAAGVPERLGLRKRAVAVRGCRTLSKRDLIHNDATPEITVNPETYEVRADGELLVCDPATELPMARRYFLF